MLKVSLLAKNGYSIRTNMFAQLLIVEDEFQDLAKHTLKSANVFGWLDVDVGFAQDVFRKFENFNLPTSLQRLSILASAIKSLRSPLKLIPASLYPIN